MNLDAKVSQEEDIHGEHTHTLSLSVDRYTYIFSLYKLFQFCNWKKQQNQTLANTWAATHARSRFWHVVTLFVFLWGDWLKMFNSSQRKIIIIYHPIILFYFLSIHDSVFPINKRGFVSENVSTSYRSICRPQKDKLFFFLQWSIETKNEKLLSAL